MGFAPPPRSGFAFIVDGPIFARIALVVQESRAKASKTGLRLALIQRSAWKGRFLRTTSPHILLYH